MHEATFLTTFMLRCERGFFFIIIHNNHSFKITFKRFISNSFSSRVSFLFRFNFSYLNNIPLLQGASEFTPIFHASRVLIIGPIQLKIFEVWLSRENIPPPPGVNKQTQNWVVWQHDAYNITRLSGAQRIRLRCFLDFLHTRWHWCKYLLNSYRKLVSFISRPKYFHYLYP